MKRAPVMFPSSRAPRRAFTLVELLAVIAIVGVLSAIIIAVVGSVRDSARKSTLASNLRSVATGLHLYASDNRDRFPSSSDWQLKVGAFLPGEVRPVAANSVFRDPLDTAEYTVNGTRRYAPNIALNGMATDTSVPVVPQGASMRLRSTILHPSRMLLVSTGQKSPTATDAQNQDAAWGFVARFTSNAYRDSTLRAQMTRDLLKHHCAYVDGHVEVLSADFMAAEAAKDTGGQRTSVFFDYYANSGSGP